MKIEQPYLTLVATNKCNYRCFYCSPDGHGGMGEGFGVKNDEPELEDLVLKSRLAESMGTKKIRVTGGEPTLIPWLPELLQELGKGSSELSVATNGFLQKRDFGRAKVRISLDTIIPEDYRSTCGAGDLARVLESVFELRDMGVLDRIACVVTNRNYPNVSGYLRWAIDNDLSVKFFDLYATVLTKDQWVSEYADIGSFDSLLQLIGGVPRQIGYTKSFGIPAKHYDLPNGTYVRVKDSMEGTRYGSICGGCDSYPCQEGLYTVAYADKKLLPCRQGPQYEAGSVEDFVNNLGFLQKVFQRSYFSRAFWRDK